MSDNKLVFAFDVGTGSLGICVRRGEEIKKLESLIIPHDYGETKTAANRRRMIRTRLAHRTREQWWRDCAKEAGIEVMETRQPKYGNKEGEIIEYKPDPRMLWQFSPQGDNTVYNSALLRIMLLQGRKLEGWQIFKAVWSAIQYRGFLPADGLPWAKANERKRKTDEADGDAENSKKKKENDDEAVNAKAAGDYEDFLKTTFPKEEHHYPCYYEAYQMGLWSPDSPNGFKVRHEQANPAPARNKDGTQVKRIPHRELVEGEVKKLLENAAKQFPKLSGKIDYIVYGEGEKAFPSMTARDRNIKRGSDKEAKALLGQKTPRFDNRCVNQCCVISRFNVCKADDILNKEVSFLLALKNMRYIYNTSEIKYLKSDEINAILNDKKYRTRLEKWRTSGKDKNLVTPTEWRNFVKSKPESEVNPAQPSVPAPKLGGRSRFCRPALRILKELILSGKTPLEFYNEETAKITNTDKRKGLIKEDYRFLLDMGKDCSWKDIHIPDGRENKLPPALAQERIKEIINEVRNPVVRHRLNFLVKQLEQLKRYGTPDKVMLEFVRNDFMGEEAKIKYNALVKANEKEKETAFKDAQSAGLKGKDAVLKVRLFREQNGIDYYASADKEKLSLADVANCDIDHIVPRSQGGPDALYNLILTRRDYNQDKGDRTPHEWLSKDAVRWESLKARLKECKLSKKKQELLLAPNAQELVERYASLAQTAYIAKLAQKIISLFFGWNEGAKDSDKRILISNGNRTAEIRRRRDLNSILHPEPSKEEIDALRAKGGDALRKFYKELDEKNREDDRHHALDALVISVIPDYLRKKYEAPNWLTRPFVKKEMEKVIAHQAKFEKTGIAETMYSLRKVEETDKKGKKIITYSAVTSAHTSGKGTRLEDWIKMKVEKVNTDKIYSLEIRTDFENKLKTNPTQEEWEKFVKEYRCKNGSRPVKIKIVATHGIKSKDGTLPQTTDKFYTPMRNCMKGQYITYKGSHQGQFVCKNEKGKWEVIPVYVWESLGRKRDELLQKYGADKMRFFKSQQTVEIKKICDVPSGVYKLSTIPKDGRVGLVKNTGEKIKGSHYITHLIEEGGLVVKEI